MCEPKPLDIISRLTSKLLVKETDKDNVFCAICQNLIDDPVQLNTSPQCPHIYCKKCIDQQYQFDRKCSVCRLQFSNYTKLSFYRKVLDDIEFKCPNVPCTMTGTRSKLISHERDCVFEPMQCNDCANIYPRSKFHAHKPACPLCHIAYCPVVIGKHMDMCPELQIPCSNQGCDVAYKYKDKNAHVVMCMYETVECKNMCKFSNKRKFMSEHQPVCPKRLSECFQCHGKIRMDEQVSHLNVCPETVFECNYKCGNSIKVKDMKEHDLICLNKIVKCKYSSVCDLEGHRSMINEHEVDLKFHLDKSNELLNEIKNMYPEILRKVAEKSKSKLTSTDVQYFSLYDVRNEDGKTWQPAYVVNINEDSKLFELMCIVDNSHTIKVKYDQVSSMLATYNKHSDLYDPKIVTMERLSDGMDQFEQFRRTIFES